MYADGTTQTNLIRYIKKAIGKYEKEHIKMISRISAIRFRFLSQRSNHEKAHRFYT